MAKPNVAEKTVNTVLELTGKFTLGFIKAVTGKGSATKEKNLSFGGKAKVKKDGKDTASKIKPLKQGNELLDMLMKIYNFMNKNFEEDKLHREKLNNFKEEAKIEADKRHKALLAQIALLMKEQKGGEVTAEKEQESGNILDSIFGAVGGISTLLNIAKFFVATPLGIAILGATTLFALLATDKNAEATNQGIQTAGDVSKQAASVTEAAADLIGGRKNRLLSERPSSKKSYFNPKKDAELQAKYLQEIGFDETTGLTQAEKDAGYTSIDEDFNPIKVKSPTTESSGAPTTPSASPATAAATSAPASSQVSTASSLSPGETAMPAAAAPASAKLNAVQSENNTAKVNALTEPSSSTINNVSSSTALQKPAPQQRVRIPSVRNLEESFQKMITYSTRVV
jgi:hypothetical protein